MDYIQLFDDVEKEFGKETAILSVISTAITLSIKFKDKDLLEEGSFKRRRDKKIKKTLWEHEDKIELVIDMIPAYYDFINTNSLSGPGKSLKEFLEYEQNRKNNEY